MSFSQFSCDSSSSSGPVYLKGENSLYQVKACEVGTGCVLWLPSKGFDSELECENRNCDRCSIHLEDGAYDHPVVVLRAPHSNNNEETLLVAIITSFRSTPLEKYLRERRLRDDGHLSMPIAKAGYAGLDNQGHLVRSLGLEGKQGLRVQSYVNLRHHSPVPLARLRQYGAGPAARAYDFRLTKTSYRALMKTMGLIVSQYQLTQHLRSNTKSYFSAIKILQESTSRLGSRYEPLDALRLPSPEYFESLLSEVQATESQDEEQRVMPCQPELQPLLGAPIWREESALPSRQGHAYSLVNGIAGEIRYYEPAIEDALPRVQSGRYYYPRHESLFRTFVLKPLYKIKWKHIATLAVLVTVLGTGYGLFVYTRCLLKLIVAECRSIFNVTGHQLHALLIWIQQRPAALSALLSKNVQKDLHKLHG